MKKELYQAMVNRLREITNENTQECVFKDLGLWKPEILNEVSNLSDKRPAIFISYLRNAIFIEFLPIIWKAPCSGVQNGNVQIRLHIIGTESTELENSLQLLDLAETVKEHIVHWQDSDYGRIVCVESAVNHEQALKECIEMFQISIRQ